MLAAVQPRDATVTAAPNTGLRSPKYSPEKEANNPHEIPSSVALHLAGRASGTQHQHTPFELGKLYLLPCRA